MCALQGFEYIDDSGDAQSGDTPGEQFGCLGVRPGDDVSSAAPAAFLSPTAVLATVAAAIFSIGARGQASGDGASPCCHQRRRVTGFATISAAAALAVLGLLARPSLGAVHQRGEHPIRQKQQIAEESDPPVVPYEFYEAGPADNAPVKAGTASELGAGAGAPIGPMTREQFALHQQRRLQGEAGRACPYIGGGRLSAPNYQLSNCTQYQPNACCTDPEVVALTEAPPQLRGGTPDCYSALNYITCSPCSSRQSEFYIGSEQEQQQVRVCSGFCDQMFDVCRSARLIQPSGRNDDEQNEGRRVDDLFEDGTAMCAGMGFQPISQPQNNPLFGYFNRRNRQARGLEGCFGVEPFHEVFSSGSGRTAGVGLGAVALGTVILAMVASTMGLVSDGDAPAAAGSGSTGLRSITVRASTAVVACTAILLALAGAIGPAPASADFTRALAKSLGEAVNRNLEEVAESQLRRSEIQAIYDNANYTLQQRDGAVLVQSVRNSLSGFFQTKLSLVEQMADDVAANLQANAATNVANEPDFIDTDTVLEMPGEQFDVRYQQHVSFQTSSVKIPEFANRDVDNERAKAYPDGVLGAAWGTNSIDDALRAPQLADSSVRWSYFGQRSGVFRQMPGRRRARNYFGFTSDYNPLTRPWYVGATGQQKDVVILLDCTRSMVISNRQNQAIEAVRTVISTLSPEDRFNVICMQQGYHRGTCGGSECIDTKVWYRHRQTHTLGCGRSLQFATPANKDQVLAKLSPSMFDGQQDWGDAIQLARDLFRDSGRACDTVLMVITDSFSLDTSLVQGYSHTKCDEDGICTDYYSADRVGINKRQMRGFAEGLVNLGHRVFSVNLQRPFTTDLIAGAAACNSAGQIMPLWGEVTVFEALRPYFDYLRESVELGSSQLSQPYIDSSGLGLIMTASAPVYVNGDFQGIVGIDATLQEVENALISQKWGTVYAFLINGEERAIVHPLLRPSDELTSDPIYPDVAELEAVEGTPQFDAFMTQVRAPMIAGTTGQASLINMRRRLPKGDKLDGETVAVRNQTYYFSNIPGTEFSFAYVFQTGLDDDFRVPTETGPGNIAKLDAAGDDFYHRLDKYTATDSGIPQSRLTDLGAETRPSNDRLYPGLEISTRHSTYKLAPSAFCQAEEYILDTSADGSFGFIDGFMRADYTNSTGTYPNPGCDLANSTVVIQTGGSEPASETFRTQLQVRPDVELTHAVDPAWVATASGEGAATDVVWRYTSTVQGVFRIYPGTRMPHRFNPTTRPWFQRGLSSKGRLALTTPYLDAASAQRISTIASPVFAGRGTTDLEACSSGASCESGYCYDGYCATTQIEGVAGIDFLYEDLQSSLATSMGDWARQSQLESRGCFRSYDCPSGWLDGATSCETQCFLVDSAGLLQMDPLFVEVQAAAEAEYSSVSLGERAGPVMLDLLRRGFASRVDAIDYQGTCTVTREEERVPVTLEGLSKSAAEADAFARTRGDFAPYDNTFGCVQKVRYMQVHRDAVDAETDGVVRGDVRTSCYRGEYYFVPLEGVDSFLLVVENAAEAKPVFPLACHVDNHIAVARQTGIVNQTCADEGDQVSSTQSNSFNPTCPAGTSYSMQCQYSGDGASRGAGAVSVALASILAFGLMVFAGTHQDP